ncbi:UNKNOWN [Stylonychia lemnae]|uniref:Uncharacterized protein n=1 Tax=Stylonychia lemnae TaxID=5949 RepID=A0A078A9L8_STYLE|nr:UNKNOWN [Stylonychia lemnae]|eukprot:CDW77493.1 UNKNOWN [Stylonychia lemnae]
MRYLWKTNNSYISEQLNIQIKHWRALNYNYKIVHIDLLPIRGSESVSLSIINDWSQTITPIIHRYALVSISQMSFGFVVKDETLVWETREDDFPLIRCPPGRFLGEKKITETLNIESSFLCPDNFNLTLQGSFTSKQAKFLRINVRRCEESRLKKIYPNETCASSTEIDKVFENMQLFIPMFNQYFDDYDHSPNPIKTTIQNSYFTTLPNVAQSYFMKISQNKAVIRDSYLSNNIHEQTFLYYTIRQEYQFNKLHDSTFSPIQITVALDENFKQTIRETYTLADALSNTGGFMQIVNIIAMFLVSGIQNKLYYFSIIKELLIHKEYQPKQRVKGRFEFLMEEKSVNGMISTKLKDNEDLLNQTNRKETNINSSRSYNKMELLGLIKQ